MIGMGVIAFVYNYLLIDGVARVPTGIYSSVLVLQILFGIYFSMNMTQGTMMNYNTFEIIGLLSLLVGLIAVIYNAYKIEKTPKGKSELRYGVLCLIGLLCLSTKDRFLYLDMIQNPYATLFLQSSVMLVLSIFAYSFMLLFYKTECIFKNVPTNLSSFLYILIIPVFISDFVRTLLINTEYDYESFSIVSLFILTQSMIGFALDYFYYKNAMTVLKGVGICCVLVGILFVLYGYYGKSLLSPTTTTSTSSTSTSTTSNNNGNGNMKMQNNQNKQSNNCGKQV
jgi:drug/metabolite transporter (DMT)-like permease